MKITIPRRREKQEWRQKQNYRKCLKYKMDPEDINSIIKSYTYTCVVSGGVQNFEGSRHQPTPHALKKKGQGGGF